MAAHQTPPSLGFSRQEHWSGCHFLLQCMKVKSESEVAQSCQTLRSPMDCSLPGSSVHGVFQARVLEWGAITFSDRLPISVFLGFPCGSDGKESSCNGRKLGSIPGLGRSPEGRHGNPFQYSCLENPHG